MFDFCMPHLLYGHGDIPKKPSDVIMFVKGRVAKTFQEAVLEKGGGRALEHPRGLPFAPAVENACRGECLQSWVLGTSEVMVSLLENRMGDFHTCSSFLPVCFFKCLPEESLFPCWRWNVC